MQGTQNTELTSLRKGQKTTNIQSGRLEYNKNKGFFETKLKGPKTNNKNKLKRSEAVSRIWGMAFIAEWRKAGSKDPIGCR